MRLLPALTRSRPGSCGETGGFGSAYIAYAKSGNPRAIGGGLTCLRLAGRLFQQRYTASAHSFRDGIAEEPHHPRQFDLDAHGIVQHFDPTGDPLLHCRCGKVQSVPLPVVIEPTEEGTQFALQAVDATVKPTPRLLPAEPVWDRNDQRL